MFTESTSDISKTSVISSRSRRSGKSLSERIRELGVTVRSEHFPGQLQTLQFMVLKIEKNEPSNYSVMTPKLNLEQLIYYQPERVVSESSPNKDVYKIQHFETKCAGRKELQRISDIEVKSYKPAKKMKFRRKKRHSSIIAKVEDILNRGKEPRLPRDPSEESILGDDEEREEPPKTIKDLPESVLQKIFSCLNQTDRVSIVPRVCKSWYYISKDPVFWKELEFTGSKISAQVIIALLQQYSSLERLRLTSVPDVVEVLQELCRCNHFIKELRVKHCSVSNLDFSRIILHVVSCCTDIEVLDLKGMRFMSERFYLQLGRLKKLKSINLSGNKFLKSQDLITLAVNCRALQDLRIIDINLDSTQGTVLKDDDLIFILSHLQRNLHTLKMDMHQLGNISYQAILNCSNLHTLVLKNCLLLSSDVFRQFPAFRNLKKLKLTRAINIKADDFQFVFAGRTLRTIQHLDLNGCWNVGSAGLRAVTNRLSPSLIYLSLKNCKSIRGNDLSLLSACTKLTNLNLAHTNVDSNNLALPHKLVANLKELVLSWEVSRKSLKQFRKLNPTLTIKLSFSEYQKDERIFEFSKQTEE